MKSVPIRRCEMRVRSTAHAVKFEAGEPVELDRAQRLNDSRQKALIWWTPSFATMRETQEIAKQR